MRKLMGIMLCAMLLIVAVSAQAEVVEGRSTGRNGALSVAVTLEGDTITDIQVTAHTETVAIGTEAVSQMPGRILAAQSVEVDSVAGATITSAAIKLAVKDALKTAGKDVSAYQVKPEQAQPAEKTAEADVVIVGGGGAGLAAAASALQSGAQSVIIVEKTDILGGDTSVNGGIYNTPDSAMQYKTPMTEGNRSQVMAAISEEPVSDAHRELIAEVRADYDAYLASGETGIFDSAAWFALQTWNGGDKVANLELVKTMCYNAYDGYQWLISMGGTFKDVISQGPGSLYPRTHDTPSGLGYQFIDTYVNYIGAEYADRYEICFGVEANEIVVEDGAAVAVKGVDKAGNTYTFTARNGIVIATGGFAGNVDMRVQYCQSEKWPDLGRNVGCTGVAADTGDGIRMAEAIGANLVDMDQIQLLHTCSPVYGTTEDNSDKGKSVASIIFTNKEGNRFVAEDSRRDTICLAVLEQTDAIFYTVESWDGYPEGATIETMKTNNGITYADEIARGYMYYGDTIEELAEAMGADSANLRSAIEDYNASVEAGATVDEFGRTTFINKLENGPFLAVPRKPSAHHTMGGIEINANAEVINTKGDVIPKLYAAGEVTGGIHGGNRLGGNAIVDTVVMGRIAGAQAAAAK